MKFLIPVGGVNDPDFGIFTSYKHRGIASGIKSGLAWAGDNCAFSDSFNAERFLTWLITMRPYYNTCLFITVPDELGNATKTQELWRIWYDKISDWPLAFVCQDGQTPDSIPINCSAVFIGGNTKWKLSQDAIRCIEWGIDNNKHIHIGRVNWWKRYYHFRKLNGSDNFTCDGTRTRYDGVERTLKEWKKYQTIQYLPEQ